MSRFPLFSNSDKISVRRETYFIKNQFFEKKFIQYLCIVRLRKNGTCTIHNGLLNLFLFHSEKVLVFITQLAEIFLFKVVLLRFSLFMLALKKLFTLFYVSFCAERQRRKLYLSISRKYLHGASLWKFFHTFVLSSELRNYLQYSVHRHSSYVYNI